MDSWYNIIMWLTIQIAIAIISFLYIWHFTTELVKEPAHKGKVAVYTVCLILSVLSATVGGLSITAQFYLNWIN